MNFSKELYRTSAACASYSTAGEQEHPVIMEVCKCYVNGRELSEPISPTFIGASVADEQDTADGAFFCSEIRVACRGSDFESFLCCRGSLRAAGRLVKL